MDSVVLIPPVSVPPLSVPSDCVSLPLLVSSGLLVAAVAMLAESLLLLLLLLLLPLLRRVLLSIRGPTERALVPPLICLLASKTRVGVPGNAAVETWG